MLSVISSTEPELFDLPTISRFKHLFIFSAEKAEFLEYKCIHLKKWVFF